MLCYTNKKEIVNSNNNNDSNNNNNNDNNNNNNNNNNPRLGNSTWEVSGVPYKHVLKIRNVKA